MASITPFPTLIAFQDDQIGFQTQGSREPLEPDPDAADQTNGGPFTGLMPLMMILFLAFLIFGGGDKKRRKKREVMLGALKKGDEVMTTGGLFGHISKIEEDVVTLVVADGVRMRFASSAIQGPAVEPEPDKGQAEGKQDDKDKNGKPTEKASESTRA